MANDGTCGTPQNQLLASRTNCLVISSEAGEICILTGGRTVQGSFGANRPTSEDDGSEFNRHLFDNFDAETLKRRNFLRTIG